MNLFLPQPACELGLNELDILLATQVNDEDPDAISKHIANLAGVQGYSAKLLASCEYLKLSGPSPTTKALYTLAERLNAGLGKSLLAHQSILGKLKAELTLASYQK
ncbi:hypothetical protein CLV58_109241 [Spirosoma oryzae]|uniref:Uncharacterized protein n=1 Tax=Spirosoma oryzae TaxID=1469603 RepID=A0A2T0SYN3_9BACT|nr:hypothetical protein [Spirosoma oryzae]PRY38514.1 hypothetical protein CLV58_109241 [Spirosoma oryzae]